jgi:hypothetical protein
MKFNLKNRPRKEEQKLFITNYGKIKAPPIFKFDEDAVEQWFEGFEKELREKYAKLCKKRIWDIAADHQCFLIEELLDAEADEILGETKK